MNSIWASPKSHSTRLPSAISYDGRPTGLMPTPFSAEAGAIQSVARVSTRNALLYVGSLVPGTLMEASR